VGVRAAGWTQLELGVLGGLSQPEIALVELGKRNLSGAAKVRIVWALDLSRDEVNVIRAESVPGRGARDDRSRGNSRRQGGADLPPRSIRVELDPRTRGALPLLLQEPPELGSDAVRVPPDCHESQEVPESIQGPAEPATSSGSAETAI
jgi:transcriptional regulator with XRE-family HTH domain